MQRTRHMVEIAEDSWQKLSRLAQFVDSTYIYKGRPRYGRLIELAIEKLEDSLIEWTEEEIEEDAPVEPDNDMAKEWWSLTGDLKAVQTADGWIFGGTTPQGEALHYKPSTGTVSETLLKFSAATHSTSKEIDAFNNLLDEIKVKVNNDPNIKTHTKVQSITHASGSTVVVLSCELTQAMSAPQQKELHGYMTNAAKKYVKKLSGSLPPTELYMKNIPWNKLYIDFSYQPGTVLVTDLNVVAHNLCMTLENWLLNRNLINPMPLASQ